VFLVAFCGSLAFWFFVIAEFSLYWGFFLFKIDKEALVGLPLK